MDPVSQGAIGAVFAQSIQRREQLAAAAWLGVAAGMAPDLDVFIQSSTDPLLFLEYHRHFTHALVFIPFGAAIVATALFPWAKRFLTFKQAYLACFLGYASHGLLDACTSYGTQLFWPFSDQRVTWNNIAVVDPAFTLPLLACVIISYRRRARVWAWAGIAWAVFYLLLGVVQLQRATGTAEALIAERGHHSASRLTMKPSFANLLLWKSIYEYEGAYYVDAVRVGTTRTVCEGEHLPKLTIDTHLPGLVPGSQQAVDLERFRWFSQDYLASTGKPGQVTDVRYSMLPNSTAPMWGITIDPQRDNAAHVDWYSTRDVDSAARAELWRLLRGQGCRSLSN
ncbi:MAG: metal-dependent hydrolase [Pseudomonadota bacterium]